MTYLDLITLALSEIRAMRAGDVPPPDDVQLAGQILQGLLDEWNANRRAVFAELFQEFTLIPNHSPHTIGPSAADFTVTVRPVTLERALIGLNTTSPVVYVPLNVRDYKWYARQTVPGITNALPRDIYYEPTWPNGSIYLWGVPTVNYLIRCWFRAILATVAAPFTTTFSLPPGYQNALYLTLAERLCTPFGQTLPQATVNAARIARSTVFDNNDEECDISTADAGLGGQVGVGVGFNWLSRTTN